MRKKKKKGFIRGIFSYLCAVALTVVFALYLSGRIGWFFFSVMVILPIISTVYSFFVIMSRFITISADASETEIYKNNKVKIRFTIKNRTYFPSPPIVLFMQSSDALSCNVPEERCTVSVMPRSQMTVDAEFTANIWCAASAGLKALSFTDYTGLFSFRLNADFSALAFKISIIPDIMDVQVSDGLLKNVNDAAARNDDSEESRESVSPSFNGVPGYDHREYVPGDPIKRINWKLSCKKDTYMVRLDDELLSSKHTIVLDRVNSGGNASCGEVCGEYMLGMLRAMARTGIEADVWCFIDGQWLCTAVSDENDVEQLRFSLAGYGFSENAPERIPSSEISEHGKCTSLIFFTPCYDSNLAEQVLPQRTSAKTDTSVTAAAASVADDVHISEIWLLSPNGTSELVL